MAIEAPHYQESRDRLAADPIVIELAASIPAGALPNLVHADGSPNFRFMQKANAEFAARGGDPESAKHIGAVAEAIIIIKEGV